MENRISADLTDEQLAQVLDLIRRLEAALPFLIALTPDERRSLLRMGDARRPFVDQALKLVQTHAGFLPRNFAVEEFATDVRLQAALDTVYTRLAPLIEKLADTRICVASEAYRGALEVYRYARQSGTGQGLDELIDQMGKRFVRRSRSAKTTEP